MKKSILTISIIISLATYGATSIAEETPGFATLKATPNDEWKPCMAISMDNDLLYPDEILTNNHHKVTEGGSIKIWNVLEDGTVTVWMTGDSNNKIDQAFFSTNEKVCLDFVKNPVVMEGSSSVMTNSNISDSSQQSSTKQAIEGKNNIISVQSSALENIQAIINLGSSNGLNTSNAVQSSVFYDAMLLNVLHNNTIALKNNKSGETFFIDTTLSDNSSLITVSIYTSQTCITSLVLSTDEFLERAIMAHKRGNFNERNITGAIAFSLPIKAVIHDYAVDSAGFLKAKTQSWLNGKKANEIASQCGNLTGNLSDNVIQGKQLNHACKNLIFDLISDDTPKAAFALNAVIWAYGKEGRSSIIKLSVPKLEELVYKLATEDFVVLGAKQEIAPFLKGVVENFPSNQECSNRFTNSMANRINALQQYTTQENALLSNREEANKMLAQKISNSYQNYRSNIDIVSKVLNYSEDGNEFGSEYGYWYPRDKNKCIYAKKDSSGNDVKVIDLNQVDPRGVKIGIGVDIMKKKGYIIRLGDVYEFFCAHEFISQAPKCEADRLTRGWNRVYNEFCKGLEKDF